jgi:hypothetical protein
MRPCDQSTTHGVRGRRNNLVPKRGLAIPALSVGCARTVGVLARFRRLSSPKVSPPKGGVWPPDASPPQVPPPRRFPTPESPPTGCLGRGGVVAVAGSPLGRPGVPTLRVWWGGPARAEKGDPAACGDLCRAGKGARVAGGTRRATWGRRPRGNRRLAVCLGRVGPADELLPPLGARNWRGVLSRLAPVLRITKSECAGRAQGGVFLAAPLPSPR